MRLRLIALIVLFVLLAACAQATQSANPAWVDELVEQFENDPVGNPPQSIWRYEYSGQTVYYVPQQCCDQFSTLYDAGGVVICAPDGGLTGQGDGRCRDFFEKRTGELLIWQDSRTR
jgi:hypothetical protein